MKWLAVACVLPLVAALVQDYCDGDQCKSSIVEPTYEFEHADRRADYNKMVDLQHWQALMVGRAFVMDRMETTSKLCNTFMLLVTFLPFEEMSGQILD